MATDSVPALLSVNSTFPDDVIDFTGAPCQSRDVIIERWLKFDTLHLVRVLITWVLFVLSLGGNSFVIWALSGSRSRHFIMFHLALSDLVYTLFVMPADAVWNTTMEWVAGDAACRICQMMKQCGMYASSFMVVVMALDRVTGILCPISYESQRRRGVVMVIVAWISSLVCCVPAGTIFSVITSPTCEGIPIRQCVDFNVIQDRSLLPPYYFFTMFMSFILPLLATLVSYSLIVCEISNMKERDRVLMGRRNSVNAASMQKAKNRTILMRTLITMTFLVCWGPYYGKGIYDWFKRDDYLPPAAVDTAMYITMYLNPVLHPIVFGIFMKEIRKKFYSSVALFRNCVFKGKTSMTPTHRHSCSSYVTATSQIHHNSRASANIVRINEEISSHKKLLSSELL